MTTGLGRVHFVGIGGAGMSGIARILLARGVPVSGSDAKDSTMLAALRALGARIDVGHCSSQRRRRRHRRGVQRHSADQSRGRRGPRSRPHGAAPGCCPRGGHAGPQGDCRRRARQARPQPPRCSPSRCSTAVPTRPSRSAATSTSRVRVPTTAPATTSSPRPTRVTARSSCSRRLLPSSPTSSQDHLDHYADEAAVEAAFVSFSETLDPQGFLVTCADDPGARRIAGAAAAAGVEVTSYGTADDADLRIEQLRLDGHTSESEIVHRGRRMGTLGLQVPGEHNVRNAAGTLAVGLRLGFPYEQLAAGLAGFRGARRRFELKGVRGRRTGLRRLCPSPDQADRSAAGRP